MELDWLWWIFHTQLVGKNFEELDCQKTPLGELILQRRRYPHTGDLDVFEVKLNDEYLMTSLFHESEDQLAHLALRTQPIGGLSVLVGGLGLGYTAVAALKSPKVNSLTVVEYLEPVISWHQHHLVPNGECLSKEPRCSLEQGDFFEWIQNEDSEAKNYNAILLDIDHSPTHYLKPSNASFYSVAGLELLKKRLLHQGVFALWSDGKTSSDFIQILEQVFDEVSSHAVEFKNPINNVNSVGTVYLAQ